MQAHSTLPDCPAFRSFCQLAPFVALVITAGFTIAFAWVAG